MLKFHRKYIRIFSPVFLLLLRNGSISHGLHGKTAAMLYLLILSNTILMYVSVIPKACVKRVKEILDFLQRGRGFEW
jgi:hypothetical protein